jgi:ATP-dependent helicase/nuclease subunit B
VSRALKGIDDAIDAVDLDQVTIDNLIGSELTSSVSGLEQFYSCEYKYFLGHTLHLQEPPAGDLDSRGVGNFFHRVYELLGKAKPSAENFDTALSEAIESARQEFQSQFDVDNTSTYLWSTLTDTVSQGATMFKKAYFRDQLQLKGEEVGFGFGDEIYKVGNVRLHGLIDRVDELFGDAIGAIDYKSGNKNFDVVSAYDGNSLQLLTYLDYLRTKYPEDKLWGAMYLHVKNAPVKLTDVKGLEEVPKKLLDSAKYKGLITDEYKQVVKEWDLYNFEAPSKGGSTEVSPEALTGLIGHNEALITSAVDTIQSGKIAINPTSKIVSGRQTVSACTYCKFKSICRFDSNFHMQAARLTGQKSKDEILDELTNGVKEETEND